MYTSINQSELHSSRIQAADPFSEYDELFKRYQDSSRERDEMQRELQRLRDQKDMMKLKEDALGAQPGSGGEAKKT